MPLGKIEEFQQGQDNWEEYVERLDQFFVANDIQDGTKKRAILLSGMGSRTYGTVRSLLSPRKPHEVTYAAIVETLRKQFCPPTSVTVARYRFFSCSRTHSESVQDFVARLRQLPRDCKFESFLDEMIRDRLVCGVNSDPIQRRLLAEAELTLPQAIDLAVAMETAGQNLQELAGSTQPSSTAAAETSVHRVRSAPSASSRSSWERRSTSKQTRYEGERCWRCLNRTHSESECQFKRKRCFQCSKYGHTTAAHRAGTVKHVGADVVHQDDDEVAACGEEQGGVMEVDTMESDFLGEVFRCRESIHAVKCRPPIMLDVTVDGRDVKMELDTGASVSVCSLSRLRELWPDSERRLQPCGLILHTFSGETLKVLGEVLMNVVYRGDSFKLPLVVIEGTGPILFGRNWLERIRLDWRSICMVTTLMQLDGVDSLLEKYPDVFADELGCAKDIVVDIPIDPNTRPIFYKPRPVPLAYRGAVDAELDRQIRAGLLEPVKYCTWAAPIVTAPKSSGEVRICGDYRLTVNKVTPLESYPMPKTEELFTIFQGARIFTKLDLKSAYNQLKLQENSRKYLAINTHKGILVPTRLGFGYASAPAIFQRYMESILAGVPGVGVLIDDVIVSAGSEQEHLQRLEEVLKRLSDAGLRLQRKKCQFGTSSVVYLGHHITAEGIRPTADKVGAIERAPEPKNLKELQAWLGLVNYYAKFMQNLATELAPLYQLLKKEQKWEWGPVQRKAFQKTKSMLKSTMTLAHFDDAAPVILACDASPVGVGCVLSIVDKSRVERPVAFYSRSLTETERRYSQTDREGLAVIAGLARFNYYLAGREFTIRTDHKPLLGMLGGNKPVSMMASPRVTRWAMLLSGYKYRMEYVPGTKQGNCDGLSRLPVPAASPQLPVPAETVNLMQFVDASPITAESIRLFTARDPVLSAALRFTRDGWPSGDLVLPELVQYRNKEGELSTHDGCLLWGSRVVIPQKIRQSVLSMLHEGHLGESHTKSFARMYVWWPGIDREISEMVRQCSTCQQYRRQAPVTPLSPWAWPKKPWDRVHIDHCQFDGHVMLVVVDAFSKWIDVHLTRSTTAETTMELLRRSFAYFGIPRSLVSDNATCFTAPAFEAFCKQLGIRHLLTAPLSAKSNGLAERCVQTVKQGLRKQKNGSIDTKLCRFLFTYRTSPHSTTGQTPAELMMGRRLRTRMDCLLPDLQDRVAVSQQQMKERYDRRSQDRVLTPGMRVWVSQVSTLAGVGKGTRWLPGHCVSCSGSKITVQLEDGRVIQRHLDFVVPNGPSTRTELNGGPEPSMPPEWLQPSPPPLSPEVEGRVITATPGNRQAAACARVPGSVESLPMRLPSPPVQPLPSSPPPPPVPPPPPSASERRDVSERAQAEVSSSPLDSGVVERRYNLRPRPLNKGGGM